MKNWMIVVAVLGVLGLAGLVVVVAAIMLFATRPTPSKPVSTPAPQYRKTETAPKKILKAAKPTVKQPIPPPVDFDAEQTIEIPAAESRPIRLPNPQPQEPARRLGKEPTNEQF